MGNFKISGKKVRVSRIIHYAKNIILLLLRSEIDPEKNQNSNLL